MARLAGRLAAEHVKAWRVRCSELPNLNGYREEECDTILQSMSSLDLLSLGRLRAVWQLDLSTNYAPSRGSNHDIHANLILGVALLARVTESQPTVYRDGQVVLRKGAGVICTVVPISGSSTKVMSFSSSAANWVTPTVTISSSTRYHSCVSEYFRSAGTFIGTLYLKAVWGCRPTSSHSASTHNDLGRL